MRVRLIAVGTRMEGWVQAGWEEYARRLRPVMPLGLVEVPAARRGGAGDVPRALVAEGQRMLALLAPRDHVVALDEHGRQMSSIETAHWLERRRASGRDLALLVGGADGFGEAVLERADERWSLSPLTLPHALVRVLVAEQLYRAASLLAGHPYHRAEPRR